MNPFSGHFRGRPSLRMRALCSLLLLSVATGALALSTDKKQAIDIQADTLESDEQSGTTTYAGNVVMLQGSMRIDAAELIIYNESSKITKIIALGKPARFQQKPSEQTSPVVARANKLEYNLAGDTLHLIDSAFLEQEGTSLSGNRIDYDVKRSVVKAGSDSTQTERVRMVIPADAIKQAQDEN